MAFSSKAFIAVLAVFALFQMVAAQRTNIYISETPFNRWMHAGIALAMCWGILSIIWVTVTLIHKHFGNKIK